jgi:hypothetical protein
MGDRDGDFCLGRLEHFVVSLRISAGSDPKTPAREENVVVAYTIMGEAVGFDFVAASDHCHPWLSEHGHSPEKRRVP